MIVLSLHELHRCRSCDAPIVFAKTRKGGRMPVDATPHERGNLELARSADGAIRAEVVQPGDGTHRSHFASCPHSEAWRR